jgi:RHS repeat-associated protein
VATLEQTGNDIWDPDARWLLTFKNGSTLRFNRFQNTGTLLSETDRNGNTVTYTWGTGSLTISAANGQQIQVGFDPFGKVTGASYATADGTRQVAYTTAPPWQVTYYPGQSMEHTVEYTYSSSRLTKIKALGFTGLVGDAEERFEYAGLPLQAVSFPDRYSSVPLYGSANADARALFTYNGRSATVTRYGTVRTPSYLTGQTSVPITQTFTWNPGGALTSRTNPKVSGADETWTYTRAAETNYLLSETSPLATTRSFTYDGRGNVLTETDELNHTTTYTYPASDTDPNRDLPLTVTDPRGAVTSFTYDAAGNPTLLERTLNQDPTDNLARTAYAYADVLVGAATYHGALVQERKLVSGSTWAVTDYDTDVYHPNGTPKATTVRDVLLQAGDTTTVDLTSLVTCDAFGNVLTRTDNRGVTTDTDTYDLAGRLIEHVGPTIEVLISGNLWPTQIVQHHVYDPWGHETESWETSTADASGEKANWRTTSYTASGLSRVITNRLWTAAVPAGQVQSTITCTYDGRGLEITRADSTVSGQPALFTYDAAGNVVTSWRAGLTSYSQASALRHVLADDSPAYDALGRLLRTIQPGNAAPEISTYTDTGLLLRETNPDGTWVECTYDAAGNLTATLSSKGTTTGSVYDLGNRQISHTEENGLQTSYTYDCLDRRLSAAAAGQPATQFTSNVMGTLLTTIDPDGLETQLAYDESGQPLMMNVAGCVTSNSYYADGSLAWQSDPDGNWTSFLRDCLGRHARMQQGTAENVILRDTTTSHDSLGRVTATNDQVVDLASQWAYPLGTAGSTTGTLTVGPVGEAVETSITIAANGLETVRQSSVESSPQTADITRTVVTRDAGDRLTNATISAGEASSIVGQYAYDSAGRLSKQWGTTGGGSGYLAGAQNTVAYEYSATSGLKTAENLQLASVGTAGVISSSYGYTPAGRLSSATTGGVTAEYVYDTLGNLLQAGPTGNQTVFSYDSANWLATATLGSSTTFFSWDTDHGRRTSQGLTQNELDPRIRYTYTGAGRLASYVDETRAPSVAAEYTYDAQGQRIRSEVTIGEQVTTTSFTYEGLALLRLAASQTGGASPSSWQITYLYDELGRPYAGVYREPSSSASPVVFGMVVTDRGDVVELLDAAGSPFAAYRYDAWGNPQGTGNVAAGVWSESTALVGSDLAAAIAARQPLRFASYCYDAESGLYYLSARHYDPMTYQFLSRDPAKADGEASAYQYCEGNPAQGTDPAGLSTATFYTSQACSRAGNSFTATATIKVSWRTVARRPSGITYSCSVSLRRTLGNSWVGNLNGSAYPGYFGLAKDVSTGLYESPTWKTSYIGSTWTGKVTILWGQSNLVLARAYGQYQQYQYFTLAATFGGTVTINGERASFTAMTPKADWWNWGMLVNPSGQGR